MQRPNTRQLISQVSIMTSPEFRFAIQAAYKRSDFTNLDRDGWNPVQYNVRIDPARPNESDPFGPGARDKEKLLKPLPGAMLF